MVFETVVPCADPDEVVRARLGAALAARGFRAEGTTFVRGGLLGTFTSISPHKWRVVASHEARGAGEQVVRLNVVALPWLILLLAPAERAFWRAELQAAARALQGRQGPDPASAEAEVIPSWLRTLRVVVRSAFDAALAFGFLATLLNLTLPAGPVGDSVELGALLGGLVGAARSRRAEARRFAG